MRRKITFLLIVCCMLLCLLPMTALAAAGDHAINLKLEKDTTTFAGKEVLRVDFMYKSGTDKPASQHVYLKFDASKLELIDSEVGDDCNALLTNFSSNEVTYLAGNGYTAGSGASKVKTEVITYALVSGNNGYLNWKNTESGSALSGFAEYTRMSSIFFRLKGIDFNAIPADAITLATVANDASVTSQVNSAAVTHSGSTTIEYLGGSSALSVPLFEAGTGVTLVKPALGGSVTVDKTSPRIGDTLTAQTGALTFGTGSLGTLTYQWKAGGANIGTNSATYTVQAADLGKKITVAVSNSNNSGSVVSAETAAVVKKAAPAAPSAPVVEGTPASDSLAVKAIPNAEYAISTTGDGTGLGAWQTGTAFSGLISNTDYYVYARIAETSDTEASAASAASAAIKTAKAAGTITITPAPTIIYDGANVEAGTSGKDLIYTYNDNGIVTIKWYADNGGNKGAEISSIKDAGTYWVGISATGGDAYGAVAEVSKQFTIGKKNISSAVITLGTAPTYSGSEQTVGITTVTVDSLTLAAADYDITAGTDKATDVETKALEITGKGNYTGTATVNWSLAKAAPVIGDFSVPALVAQEYTGSPISVPAPSTAKTGMGAVTLKYDGSITAPTAVKAGGYAVTFDVAEGANYSAATGFAYGTLTVSKMTVANKTVADQTVRSDQTTTDATVTLPALEGAAVYPANGTVSGDAALISAHSISGNTLTYSTTAQADGKNATITVAVAESANHSAYTVAVKITARDKEIQTIGFDTDIVTVSYSDAEDFTIAATNKMDGGGAITYSSSYSAVAEVDANTGKVTIKGAGSADIMAQAAENDTYAPSAVVKYALLVLKGTVTITVADKYAYIGDAAPDLSGAVLGTDYTVEGLRAGEALATAPTLSYASTPDMTAAGTVAINAAGYALPAGGNYEASVTVTPGTLNITARPVYDPNYTITVAEAANGSVAADARSAEADTVVTLTVKADEGYELNTLSVTDWNANAIALTENADGTYSFTMPHNKVQVQASFKEQPAPFVNPFTDLVEDSYYYDAALWAASEGITQGITPTLFAPELICTRAQVVTFLWRVAGEPAAAASNPFTDVAEGTYYYDAVLWAVEQGITKGTAINAFSPDKQCTRGEIVTFLYRYAKAVNTAAVNPFTDVAEGAFYYDAVLWAVEKGITKGVSDTAFAPADFCTRGQIVTFLYRLLF